MSTAANCLAAGAFQHLPFLLQTPAPKGILPPTPDQWSLQKGWAEAGHQHYCQPSLDVLIYTAVTFNGEKRPLAWASSEAEQPRGVQSSESPWATKLVCDKLGALHTPVTSLHFHLRCVLLLAHSLE